MSRPGRPESNESAPGGARPPLPSRPGRSTESLSKQEATETLTEVVRTLAAVLSPAEMIHIVQQTAEPTAAPEPSPSAWERHDDPEMP